MFLSFLYLFNLVKFLNDTDFQFNNSNYIFNKQSDSQLQVVYRLNMTPIPIIKDLEITKSNIKNGIMQNYFFKNNMFRRIRLSYFKSDDIQIMNSIWYPSYDYECPILSIDLINKNNVSECFINLSEIYNTTNYHEIYIKPLNDIKENYSDLTSYFNKYLNTFTKKPVNRYFIEEKHRDYTQLHYNNDIICSLKDYFDEQTRRLLLFKTYY
jgi:hypothetical protein